MSSCAAGLSGGNANERPSAEIVEEFFAWAKMIAGLRRTKHVLEGGRSGSNWNWQGRHRSIVDYGRLSRSGFKPSAPFEKKRDTLSESLSLTHLRRIAIARVRFSQAGSLTHFINGLMTTGNHIFTSSMYCWMIALPSDSGSFNQADSVKTGANRSGPLNPSIRSRMTDISRTDESSATSTRSGHAAIAAAWPPCEGVAEGGTDFGLSSAHAAMTAHATMSTPRSTCRPALLWNIFTITNHPFFAVQDSWRRARHGNAESEKQHKIGHDNKTQPEPDQTSGKIHRTTHHIPEPRSETLLAASAPGRTTRKRCFLHGRLPPPSRGHPSGVEQRCRSETMGSACLPLHQGPWPSRPPITCDHQRPTMRARRHRSPAQSRQKPRAHCARETSQPMLQPKHLERSG